jgi:deoxyribodipyrimidine photo-lyase
VATTLVWFRNDLRTTDNPALFHAMERGVAVAVFCFCVHQWREHDVGDNRLAFLLDSLWQLADELHGLGVPLCTIHEPRFEHLPKRLVALAGRVGASALALNEEYPWNERQRDSRVAAACEDAGIAVHRHSAGTLLPPGSVLTGSGRPYSVFGAFRKQWLSRLDPSCCEPLPRPRPQGRPRIHDTPLPGAIDGASRNRVAARWPGGSEEAQRGL